MGLRVLLLSLLATLLALWLVAGDLFSPAGSPQPLAAPGGRPRTAGAPGLRVASEPPKGAAPVPVPVPVRAEPPPAAEPSASVEMPAWGGITGLVLSAQGHPLERVCVDLSGGNHHASDVSTWWGRFSLPVPGPGTYRVRAYVSGVFHGEVEQDVTIDEKMWLGGIRLVFPSENGVHGVALMPDGKPAQGVVVKLTSVSNQMGLGHLAEALWSSRSARSWMACRTNEEGAFGFGAVDPRSLYTLWWMGDDGQPVRHPDEVQAGQSQLEIEVRRHRVVLDVSYAGDAQPTSDYEAHIYEPGREPPNDEGLDAPFNHGSDWDEPDYVALPGTELRVVVFHCGHTFVDKRYVVTDAWGAQEIPVRVRDLPDCARLVREARDPEGRVVPDMGIYTQYVDPDGSPVMDLNLTLIGSSGEWGTWIPPCRLRVYTALPREVKDWEDPRLFLLPAERVVDMPERGELRVSLEMARGGMAELRFLDPPKRGAYQGAYGLEYELRDERGALVPVAWHDNQLLLEESHLSRPRPGLAEKSLLTSGPRRTTALPPGRYELRLRPVAESYELAPITVPLTIVQGQVTRHAVQLVFKPR